ncbi:MAG TPA: TrmH family RNA methyltransferase [Candidatus Limnocylindrales bacterium]|nr:TrmH family RNA methyltransferase [Candidatus Limnocylindrales bacterium]
MPDDRSLLIDSPSNPRLRAALALRERRDREATGLTLVDGAREARRAIEASVEVDTAFVCRELLASDDAFAAVAALGRASGRRELVEVSRRAFEKLAYGDRSDGVVLVVRPRVRTLEDLELPPQPLVVVTEDVEKPGNVGAILRSADGAGADAVIAAGGTDLFNPNVIRASVGMIFTVPVVAAPAGEIRGWLSDRGLRVVTTRVDGSMLHADADLTGPVALVLGSEADGLSPTWHGEDVTSVRLPMEGIADSLNVSAAAAILLYEAWRQRRHAPAADASPQSR